MSPSNNAPAVLARSSRVLAGVALVMLLAACSTARKTGAAIAMPFAFVGDTLIVPLQWLGYTSEALITAGDNSQYSYHTRWGYTEVRHHDTPLSLLYYIPGYTLYPFTPFTTWDYYSMTQACHDTLTGPGPYRRHRVRY